MEIYLIVLLIIIKKICILRPTTEPEKSHYNELLTKHNINIKFSKRDYIHLYNILYKLSIYANIETVDLKKDYVYESYEALIDYNVNNIIDKSYDRKLVEEIIFKICEDRK